MPVTTYSTCCNVVTVNELVTRCTTFVRVFYNCIMPFLTVRDDLVDERRGPFSRSFQGGWQGGGAPGLM